MSTAVTEMDSSSWAVGFCPILLINIIIIFFILIGYIEDLIISPVESYYVKSALGGCRGNIEIVFEYVFFYREIQKSL